MLSVNVRSVCVHHRWGRARERERENDCEHEKKNGCDECNVFSYTGVGTLVVLSQLKQLQEVGEIVELDDARFLSSCRWDGDRGARGTKVVEVEHQWRWVQNSSGVQHKSCQEGKR